MRFDRYLLTGHQPPPDPGWILARPRADIKYLTEVVGLASMSTSPRSDGEVGICGIGTLVRVVTRSAACTRGRELWFAIFGACSQGDGRSEVVGGGPHSVDPRGDLRNILERSSSRSSGQRSCVSPPTAGAPRWPGVTGQTKWNLVEIAWPARQPGGVDNRALPEPRGISNESAV